MVNKTDGAFDAGRSARSLAAPSAGNMLWLVGMRWIAWVILVAGIVGCAILGLSLWTIPLLTMALLIFAYLSTTVSARIRAGEAEIIRSRDVLDSIITSMPDGLIFIAPGGRLVLANAAATQWFAANPGRSRPLAEEDLPPGLFGYIRNEKTDVPPGTAAAFCFEMKVTPGGTSRKFRAGRSNVRDEAGRHLGHVVLIEDVTEQLKLEEDLRAHSRKILRMSETIERNREEMAQREKMVAIGTMAAGVAHEIGNPLAAISAVVQRMRASAHKTDAQAEQLRSIAEQIDRIVAIVKGMLTFARPANGQRSPADVDKLIEDTIDIVRYSRHARNIRIESIRNMSLPKIEIMAQQFQQVLVNVLLNAFDAMEDSTREKVVSIKRTVTRGWIDLEITDNGCGMTQQQIGQAFEPFYTTKVPGRGTGLGLAVSYSLIEQQGGHIRITSTPGRGTTVTILLPTERAAAGGAGATDEVIRKYARGASERKS